MIEGVVFRFSKTYQKVGSMAASHAYKGAR
jgi:hypothetical protein